MLTFSENLNFTKVFITSQFYDKILEDHFLVHEGFVIMMFYIPQEPKNGPSKFYHWTDVKLSAFVSGIPVKIPIKCLKNSNVVCSTIPVRILSEEQMEVEFLNDSGIIQKPSDFSGQNSPRIL